MVVLTWSYAASAGTTVRINPESILVSLASLVTFLGGVYAMWRMMSRRNRQSQQFYRDWNGEQERPGVQRRPGVLEQISDLTSRVDVIHAEVNYNHGGSIKDAVDRMDSTIKVMDTRLGSVETDIKLIHNSVSSPSVQVNRVNES